MKVEYLLNCGNCFIESFRLYKSILTLFINEKYFSIVSFLNQLCKNDLARFFLVGITYLLKSSE